MTGWAQINGWRGEIDNKEKLQGRVEHGDIFVICSDGLNEHVEDHEIERFALRRPLGRAVDSMISTTLERGAKDNVTVIEISCSGVTALQPGMS